nr:MAG TPA: protein of unknown function (DUF4417) [Caudoviricetes sp.]
MLNFENLDKFQFLGVGKYSIPEIQKTDFRHCEFIPFNFSKTEKFPEAKGIHFFVDDYQFVRLWNRPENYVSLLKKFCCVCSPDFSTYTDMPVVMQIYNHYRKHWLGAYWQLAGIKVIPTITWSDQNSFDWCFDGEPTNSVVAISSVGTQKSKTEKDLFLKGYYEMLRRLNPSQVVFYGPVPEECDWNAIRISPYYKKN